MLQILDIQYTTGVATNVNTTFVTVGSQNQDGVFGFLDIINTLLAEPTPPLVLTTSFGFDETFFQANPDIAKYALFIASIPQSSPLIFPALALQLALQRLRTAWRAGHQRVVRIWGRRCRGQPLQRHLQRRRIFRPYLPQWLSIVSLSPAVRSARECCVLCIGSAQ